MIVIADLHLKKKWAYFKAQQKFLNYLNEKFSDETIVFLGDTFDSSAPHWVVHNLFKEFLLKRNAPTHILNGNHDQSRAKGSAVEGFNLLENVYVYLNETEVEIEGYKCLMLPHKHNMDSYKDIKFNGDFTFCHFPPVEEQFESEGINIEGIAPHVTQIFGHIHTAKNYINSKATKLILGVPILTRKGEKNHTLLRISSDKRRESIAIPIFLDIQTIQYGEELPNINFLYNIENAPSPKAVFEMYSEENVLDYTLERTELKDKILNKNKGLSILDKVKNYAIEEATSQDLVDVVIEKLTATGVR